MQELIAILEGMKAELSSSVGEPVKSAIIANFDRCIELAKGKPESKNQKIARLEGEVKAYEKAFEMIGRKV